MTVTLQLPGCLYHLSLQGLSDSIPRNGTDGFQYDLRFLDVSVSSQAFNNFPKIDGRFLKYRQILGPSGIRNILWIIL